MGELFERKLAEAKALNRAACVHVGPEVGQQVCSTCSGPTRIKIFACALHGQCTISKQLPVLACCAGCGQFQITPISGPS